MFTFKANFLGATLKLYLNGHLVVVQILCLNILDQ